MNIVHRHRSVFCVIAAAGAFVLLAAAEAAQEDFFSPPPPVFPALAEDPSASIPIAPVRQAIENAMTNVMNNPGVDGKLSWKSGARPTQCGHACFGPPTMRATEIRDLPNSRFVNIRGKLEFKLEVDYWFDHDVTYYYDLQVRCVQKPSETFSELAVNVIVGAPLISEAGTLESILDFLSPFHDINSVIQNAARNAVGNIPISIDNPQSMTDDLLRRCRSIGAAPGAGGNFNEDRIKWNLPRRQPAAMMGDQTATVVFDGIVRKPTGAEAPSTDPVSFSVYINGGYAQIPVGEGLTLPTAGGSAQINLCRTVPLNDVDELQILFTDDQPGLDGSRGAVWSQFTRAENFGAGPARTMTTTRNAELFGGVSVPGGPNPGGGKPAVGYVREYQLLYHIIRDQGPLGTVRGDVVGAEMAPPDAPAGDAPAVKPGKGAKGKKFKGAARDKGGKDPAGTAGGAAANAARGELGVDPGTLELDPGDGPLPGPCTKI